MRDNLSHCKSTVHDGERAHVSRTEDVFATLDRRCSPLRYFVRAAPAAMPQAFWDRMRARRALMYIGFILSSIAGVIGVSEAHRLYFLGAAVTTRDRYLLSVASILGVSGVVVTCIVPRLCKREFRRTVRRDAYAVCLRCGYCLCGLPKEHVCPECGTPYSKEHLRKQWKSWFAKKHV